MSEHGTTHDPRKLDGYLLGHLSDEESDALEVRLLHDRRFFDLAEAAEDDLVDRYVRGELKPDDRKRFERHLLPSDRLRERVATARALRSWTEGQRAPRIAAGEGRVARLAWAAALLAAIAAGALGLEVVRLHDRLEDLGPSSGTVEAGVAEAEPRVEAGAAGPEPSLSSSAPSPTPAADAERERVEQLEHELAAARERIASLESEPGRAHEPDSSRAGSPTPSTTMVFLTLATRSVGDEERLDLRGAERAELLLELGRRRPSGKVLATVSRGGELIWRESDVEVVSDAGESMARLYLPRQALVGGPHRVDLVEVAEGEDENRRPLGAYAFFVER